MMNIEHRTIMRDSDPLVKGVRRQRGKIGRAFAGNPGE